MNHANVEHQTQHRMNSLTTSRELEQRGGLPLLAEEYATVSKTIQQSDLNEGFLNFLSPQISDIN